MVVRDSVTLKRVFCDIEKTNLQVSFFRTWSKFTVEVLNASKMSSCSRFAKFGKFYKRLLCRRPILVQALQTGVLMASGDLIAQKVIEKNRKWQYVRTGQFFALGVIAVGPAMTVWYRVLARLVTDHGKTAALKKMALDQLLFAPTFTAFFIVALNLLQGNSFAYAKRELSLKYADILLANYKLWPAVQLVNFYLVPLAYQVLVVQVIALAWNAYVSWKTQQKS